VLRVIEEEVMKENTARVIAHVPVDVGTYLLNEKRELLAMLEARHKITVMLIPTPALETPNFDLQRIRADEVDNVRQLPSYDMAMTREDVESQVPFEEARQEAEIPAVRSVSPPAPAPMPAAPAAVAAATKPGLLKRVFGNLFGSSGDTEQQKQGSRRETDITGKAARERDSSRGSSRRGTSRRQDDSKGGSRAARHGRPAQSRPGSTQKPAAQPARPPEAEAEATTRTTAAEGDQANQRRSSRRGRRGGRRRSSQNRSPETPTGTTDAKAAPDTAPATDDRGPSSGDTRKPAAVATVPPAAAGPAPAAESRPARDLPERGEQPPANTTEPRSKATDPGAPADQPKEKAAAD